MALKNAYSVTPDEVQPDIDMCFVVKLSVQYMSKDRPVYRIYRCPFEGDEAPQGDRIDTDREVAVMQALFPVVAWANGKADPT